MTRFLFTVAAGTLLASTTARANNILVNPGFETGALAPWYQGNDFDGPTNWQVTNNDAHSGVYSAMDDGNKELRQDFAAVATTSILEVSFWVKHPELQVSALAYTFYYSDSTHSQFLVSTVATGWESFNVTSHLDLGKSLVGFSIYGNSGGVTLFDDAVISTSGTVPEPSSVVLAGLGALGAFGLLGRSRKRRARGDAG
jgi:hypothetical protein